MPKPSRVLLFMVVSMFLGYMPWYGFSAVLPHLVREFGLTPGETGSILSAFQLGYVLTVIASGILADRFGNKRVLVGATLATGLFSTLFAFLSGGFTSILVLRLLTGLSAGAIYAPGMALLSAWFPPEKRGMAIGSYTAALTASYGGGYCIAGPLSAVISWRWSILAISLPGFAAALLLAFFVKDGPTPALPPTSPTRASREPMFPGGLRAPFLLTLGYFGHMWELYAFWGWIGPFLGACALSAGLSAPRAESFSGLASAGIILAGSLAVAGIGFVSDRLGRRKTILMAGLASSAAELLFGFLYGRSLVSVLGIGSWIGFWCVADSAVYKASLCELVPSSRRGTALGIQSAIGYTATVFSPLVFGWVMGLQVAGMSETTRWGLAFFSLGAGALLAPAALFFFPEQRRMKRQIACELQAAR
jgi:MFS family permease